MAKLGSRPVFDLFGFTVDVSDIDLRQTTVTSLHLQMYCLFVFTGGGASVPWCSGFSICTAAIKTGKDFHFPWCL